MKKILLVLIALVAAFTLTGCGSKEEKKEAEDLSKYAGTYKGEFTKLVGDESKNEEEEFSLELNADGTGKHNRDGHTYKVTWTVEDGNFRMEETFVGDPIVYTGTIKDGKLDIFNGDKDDIFTYEYVYVKE